MTISIVKGCETLNILEFIFGKKTEAERKRDEYHTLHQKLVKVLEDHDRKVKDAASTYDSYRYSMPFLSSLKVPSSEFSEKRIELNEKLNNVFDTDKEKRLDVKIAIDRAYGRYEYYRNLAITEAQNYEKEKERERERRRNKN